jgi:peptidoglycan/LPS O-acetylase OafA/YrhL
MAAANPIPAEAKLGGKTNSASSRAYYIDRIRVVLTALVVLHHSAITYGAPGGWYYRELPTTASLTGIVFTVFVSTNQAYFMGFFFLIAGYFTPASYNRKGSARFSVDRLIRLGIPLAVFGVLLDPLTNSIARAWGRPAATAEPFLPDLIHRIFTADWNNGPLWFAQALLIFSAAYLAWRRLGGDQSRQTDSPLPTLSGWFLTAIGVGAGALLIRQWIPVGENVFQLQLGYFSSYIFLFAIGTVAWQRNWFERLTWKTVRAWIIVSIVLLPALTVTAILSGRLAGKHVNFSGGLSFPAILYAFWEPFIAWGIIGAYLVWFRERWNQPSQVWEYLAARAYTVYIIHAPVLVGIGVALRWWQAPAMAKFAVVGPLACLSSLALSSLVLRIPGARRVV